MKNQKGFSLIELLVVVIIIGIIAAIAIPSLLASRRAANEAAAVSAMRTIHSAQATFFGTTGGNQNYAADMTALGTESLIDTVLASGTKSGYDFVASNAEPVDGAPGTYCASAEASSQGTTGTRSYAVNESGVIYSYPADGAAADCSSGVLTIGGTPIQ